ncbi:poly-gamma-glutamate synthesis protein (capsule biosynthesis protein) [Halomicrobium zhouii]|uniref:Poly-gamma-glutamate synthesis protein (Capsule biosynthesis protein) n=1 Tax=Halomicrobium zhouii TaxID=767519 RepID=A0A1I6K4P2_9EURY|nr:CapA family protein [Halomicrobium zhouii]SFR86199.1 poly-gamma-glutamate synthesis protein (capsule biosynthesis protein) [Halomicrobium zhouii]
MAQTLGFTGDVMLGRNVDERQRNRPVTAVWGDVLERLRGLDGLFVNLECCLSTRGRPWRRTHRPFHFRADPAWAVPALRQADVDWANLANNHLLDFQEEALLDTLGALDEGDIAHSGAGRNERDARAPAVVDVGEVTVAFVSLTDNTPEYAAGPESPGVARLELDVDDEANRAVARSMLDRAREYDPDLLVASLHWGPNMVEEPFESHVRWGRWLLSEGVDVVHGHSAHVFEAVEARDDGLLLYDCGDFVDDYRVDEELRNDRSFLFELTVDDRATPVRLRLVPVEIRGCQVHLATGDAARWCRETMHERSRGYDTEFEREGESLAVEL